MKTRSDGVMLIAIYHFISGALSLLGMCGLFSMPLIFGLAASGSPDGDGAAIIFAVIGLLTGGLLLLIAAANWIIGWGLWRGQDWARIGAIGMAFFRLFNVPLGTIIGGLIIWYLLREETKAEFAVEPDHIEGVIAEA